MDNRVVALANAVGTPRYGDILERLKGVAAEQTGISEEDIATDVHFFQAEIGSLLLLQASSEASNDGGLPERVIAQQLQLMSQQFSVLDMDNCPTT